MLPRPPNAETPVPSTFSPPVTDGDVVVRLPAHDDGWVETLAAAPAGHVLTVTLGHPRLLPGSHRRLLATGYRIVGVATERRPVGPTVDVFVPVAVREEHPQWWATMLGRAERVFDLSLGPVQLVLAAELELHTRALDDRR